jgi:hypothetical protein
MDFIVQAEGFEDDELLAQIYGINMNMGIFEYPLAKIAAQIYTGKALLPTCMSGKMSYHLAKREYRSKFCVGVLKYEQKAGIYKYKLILFKYRHCLNISLKKLFYRRFKQF